MKAVLILAIVIWSTNTFGQTPTNKINGLIINPSKVLESDTILKVVYSKEENQLNKPAFFLNEKFVHETLFTTLNPMQIDSINVVKDSILIDNILYYGQIHIKTKSSYTLKLISLTDLKDKYTNLKNKSVVFMIDGNIINADYDRYMVDENYLLTIIVDKIENSKEKINLELIKLLTKSEQNIKNSKKIMMRGTEVALTK
ncbi:hypothetical protein GCM10022408_33520 [Hymenobacter fastidiosus]|uniref:DUF4369 domain-containing protein n=1 Tax=Hymenobacter fastidiosus TaxID=486264 RepID=A0ABP7SVS9_9BACT